MNLVFSQTGIKVRGANAGETFTAFSTPDVSYSAPSVTTPTIVLDSTMLVSSGQTVYNNAMISIFKGPIDAANNVERNYTLTNLNPTIARLDGLKLTNLTGGVSNVFITDGITKRIVACTTSANTIGNGSVWQSFAAGSLGKKLTDTLNSLIVGKSASTTTQDMTIVANPGSASLTSFIRNSNLFCASLDLTAFALATVPLATAPSVYGQDGWGVTVISPRHVVSAWHARRSNCVLVGSDGVPIDVYCPNWLQIGTSDIAIGYISDAIINGISTGGTLPSTITPLKTLPSTWRTKLPNKNITPIPVFYVGHGPRMAIGQWKESSTFYSGSLDNVETRLPDDAHQASFYNDVSPAPVSYSSGFPIFTAIDNTPILLGCWHAASGQYSGIAPMLSDHIAEINVAMSTLHGSGAYTLGTVDLTAYPTY